MRLPLLWLPQQPRSKKSLVDGGGAVAAPREKVKNVFSSDGRGGVER